MNKESARLLKALSVERVSAYQSRIDYVGLDKHLLVRKMRLFGWIKD